MVTVLACSALTKGSALGSVSLSGETVMRIISEGRRAQDAGEARVVGAEADLRDLGLRLTGPRHAVLEVVRGAESHPTAEEVHRLVRRRLPGVSLGTIYRNLRLLVGEGLLKELPGPYARFDANTRAHHHFTCERCGRIIDVDAALAEPHARTLSARVAARTGFSITNHRIELFGRCRECQNRSPGTRGRRRRPVARARMAGQAPGESLRRRRREG
jgi:Fur family peroxide stress response transcriptional regulator